MAQQCDNDSSASNMSGPLDLSELIIHLRDISEEMVKAWKETFKDEKYSKAIKISRGDIFKGGPAVDAIVSPANSFGFMDGGIDMAYSRHFGWQMQERLQEYLRQHFDGELPVGCAVIIPAYSSRADISALTLDDNVNGGKSIQYLVSAPTMRTPTDVSNTVNAYLAFRGILRAVLLHNTTAAERKVDLIRSILCPGLATAVGQMPCDRSSIQMRVAYDAIVLREDTVVLHPERLSYAMSHNFQMLKAGSKKEKKVIKKIEDVRVEKSEYDKDKKTSD